jgi:hypothetical protein
LTKVESTVSWQEAEPRRSINGSGWQTTMKLLSPGISSAVSSRHRHGDTAFNGFIDDLTIWNRSLSQGEIRALNYLDTGLNGIVVPRGLFFNSQFFSTLNTTSFSPSSPIVGSTAIGNLNPLELNARTIQQPMTAKRTGNKGKGTVAHF